MFIKKFYTEFEELQDAYSRVMLNENAMPYVNGRLVENEQSYNKIQKMLACNEMESAHKYLLDLDVENLEDDDISKIDKLFDMGVEKGYIDNSFEDELEQDADNDDEQIRPTEDFFTPDMDACAHQEQPSYASPVPCWTVMYQATKDGQTKTGQCFSNSVSVQAAKSDCLAKLSRFGYDNIQVLAIEAGDPDMCSVGCCQNDREEQASVLTEEGDEECSLTEKDLDNMMREAANNPYTAGMKIANLDSASGIQTSKTKAVKEDDEDEPAEDSGDEPAEDSGDEPAEDGDEESDDADNEDAEDDSDEDKGDDTSDEESAGDDESGDELDDDTKAELKDEYRQTFKRTMKKCGYKGKSFNDLTIAEKVKFFEELSKTWKKNEPNEFMTDKEQDQVEAIVNDEGGIGVEDDTDEPEDDTSTDDELEDFDFGDFEDGDTSDDEDGDTSDDEDGDTSDDEDGDTSDDEDGDTSDDEDGDTSDDEDAGDEDTEDKNADDENDED